MDQLGIARALDRIVAEVGAWPGVTPAPHRYGGVEFRFGRGELGHIHPSGLVDVAFPRPVRDQLVSAGMAEAHHRLPESGWVSLRLLGERDAEAAIGLLRRAWELRSERRAGEPGRAPERGEPPREGANGVAHREETLDEAIEESFPASDPPATGQAE